ncbi:MAG: hypothetical protein HC904_07965 [Blastochloris sp.]|nr:hypothetical protein [Blastochloris sp.]
MAANFLGFFGKKKDEVSANQETASEEAPAQVPASLTPPKPNAPFAPGRKKVTQRLSLKGLQGNAQATPDPNKIQLPGAAALSAAATPTPTASVDGTVDVPFSIILSSIPVELLTADHSVLLAAPEARVEVGLPLAHILSTMPSGKIEFTVGELSQAVPEGFIQPLEAIADYVNSPIVLPLGQVVSRIPPHMLTLRSDQRPIDSTVLSMQDPFSKEALEKAQAEAAAKAAEAAALQAPAGFAEALSATAEENAPVVDETADGEYAPTPSSEEQASMAEQEPEPPAFDPELAAAAAAAEAALEAERAAMAGVELPGAEDNPEMPPRFDLGLPEGENLPEPMTTSALSGVEEAEPIDPALMEWARKLAEEEASTQPGAEAAAGPMPEEEVEAEPLVETEALSSSEAFKSFLDQVEDSTPPAAPAAVEKQATVFPESTAGMFDVLNAPTRPIPKPKSPPAPPAIKGFEAFKKELVQTEEPAVLPQSPILSLSCPQWWSPRNRQDLNPPSL